MDNFKVPYNYLPLMYNSEGKLWQDIVHDIGQLVAEGDFTLGKWVERFEQAICDKYGVRYCIGVNSGTDALILTMKALDIGQGDTVLLPANSFIATANAVVAVGAFPLLMDVDEDYLMDTKIAGHRLAKAAIFVHLTGLARECNNWGITINDAAQAIGAEDQGKSVAIFPLISCFSLHPLKNLHAIGDGGFITTDDSDLADELKLLRNHGLLDRDTCVIAGGLNSRLDSVQAIAAWHGLKIIDEVNDKRRANAARYDKGLADLDSWLWTPKVHKGAKPVYHTYMVQATHRDSLKKYLADCGIDTRIHYPVPIHLQPPYKMLGYKKGDLPVVEDQAETILSLPVHEYLKDDQIDYVIETVRGFYRNHDKLGEG